MDIGLFLYMAVVFIFFALFLSGATFLLLWIALNCWMAFYRWFHVVTYPENDYE